MSMEDSGYEVARALGLNERIGELIRKERVLSGLQPSEIKVAIAIEPEELEDWENGVSSPEADRFEALFVLFGVSATARAIQFFIELQHEINEWKEAHRKE